jgi:hypothetical protein
MNPKKEKITIELPAPIMDFLRRNEADPQKYIENSLIEVIRSDLESCDGVWPTDAEATLKILKDLEA